MFRDCATADGAVGRPGLALSADTVILVAGHRTRPQWGPIAGVRWHAPSHRFKRMLPGQLRLLICAGALCATTVAGACARSSSPDAGGDTALARDLALVSLRDSAHQGTPVSVPTPSLPQTGSVAPNVPPNGRPDSAPVATEPPASGAASAPPVTDTRHATRAARTKATVSRRARTGAAACASPKFSDQNSCLRREIASNDARLAHVYNSYLARLRSAPASRGGGSPAVEKLRISEKAWLAYRVQECRRRNWGKEGTLWAPRRAECMKEMAATRTDELARLLRSGRK